MAALLNVKQFVRFDEHGNLHVPNKLFVACQAYVQTPFLNDTSSRVATTEWVRAQISSLTGVSVSETDPIWVFEKALYYTKLQADARYLQSFTETDPTVSAWAKAATKPSYAYSELTGLPTLFSGAYADLTGKPTLFSGSYTDLTNKPTIPAAQVNSDWTAITGLAQILNKPTLFSGSYTDLTNKPTIPTYTLSGLGGQPLDADLTAIAALAGTAGFLKKTAADTWALDNSTYLTSYTETDPIWVSEKANYALKTYVDTSISNLVASAPAALNTLNELALALGSDANFSTTVTTLIGTKEPAIAAGTTAQYWRGDKSWQTLPIYTLPTASTTVLGGVKVDGTTITINGSGVISGANTYTLPTASTTVLGGVKVDGTTITITGGVISGANTYSLPIASATVLGGFKVGTNLSINATTGVLSSTDTTYAVFTGATASANGTSGLVVAPLIANRAQYLKGDGTWGTPPDTDTTYAAFTGSTTLVDGAAGLVPKPVIANRLQYLRGDGTWATPPDTDTDTNTVTSIRREDADGTTSATAYRTGDIRLRQGANVTITEVSAGIFQIASSYVDTDTNTWNANTKTVAGYVAAPGDVANKVWKTDASGNPGWRDDADTDTNTTYTAGTGLTLTGTVFSVTKTITASETADTIALRNGSGQLVATGFYQQSSRELKTNINPFTKSALDIIREVTVVSFNYKTDIINKHIGFIAEDTPEELSTRNKNVMDSNNTIGVLLKAVQELEARIKQLESK